VVEGVVTHLALNSSGASEVRKLGENVVDWCTGADDFDTRNARNPQTAATQAPLHDVLSGPRVKGSHPIAWTPELHKAFEECKTSLSRATLLATKGR
jgi:hypothetical protein